MEGDIRTNQTVAQRVLGILAAMGKVHFPESIHEWLDKENIYLYLTPDETRFINEKNPEHGDLIKFSWKAEALVSLIWSLKGLDTMPPLNEQFDTFNNAMVTNAFQNTQIFLSNASLRSDDELETMESFLYHQHWRTRDRDLGFNTDKPDEHDPPIDALDSGIVYERRYGMSWVVGNGESWDDVPTDT